jgi:ADP-heptose:LPS heptosyltransferase
MCEPVAWVKDARFHIGIEGGLVHYARCVDTPSIVVHGPTGKTAFGYADNINVGHERCFDCFWKTPEWYSDPCPHEHPTCLNFPDTREVQAAVDMMLARTKEEREGK